MIAPIVSTAEQGESVRQFGLPAAVFNTDNILGGSSRSLPVAEKAEGLGQEAGQAKKKAIKKKKKAAAPVVLDLPPAPVETPEEIETWKWALRPSRPKIQLPQYGMLDPSFRSDLSTLLTPSCSSLTLTTPRLILRQVHPSDLKAIKRIKTEPIVQRTQLYGSPHESTVREAFLDRYVRSSMPRASSSRCRELFVFAITLKDPERVVVGDGARLKLGNRIKDAEGYIGNVALSLTCSPTSNPLPKPRKVYTQPSFDQTTSAELAGSMFFEVHPQLWGKGIMGEAFTEVVRFAMEEMGCLEIDGNEPCVKLCERAGFRYTHTSIDNPYRKPQAWHKLTRREWWEKNRPGEAMKGKHDGKILCRW